MFILLVLVGTSPVVGGDLFRDLFRRRYDSTPRDISRDLGLRRLLRAWLTCLRRYAGRVAKILLLLLLLLLAADTSSTRTCTQVSCGVPNIGNGGGLAWALKELGLRSVERRVQWNEAAGMLKRYAGRAAKMLSPGFGNCDTLPAASILLPVMPLATKR